MLGFPLLKLEGMSFNFLAPTLGFGVEGLPGYEFGRLFELLL